MRVLSLAALALLVTIDSTLVCAEDAQPFGSRFPGLDGFATGRWWEMPRPTPEVGRQRRMRRPPIELEVPRDQVVAFAVYTVSDGQLKLSAQLFPLRPEEPREVRLELLQRNQWREVARAPVRYPGWSAHFRVKDWDHRESVQYRVRHGDQAEFSGTVRRDPTDKNEIVVGLLSCNSARTRGPRPQILANLTAQNPDLLFFAGDQTYHHTEHTTGWLEFGLQFRDLLRDRPVITIPDDHDVGQANIWGENGKRASAPTGPDGGYYYPASYVNMVQRQQTWHLPDPYDPTPIRQGISVYYTRLRVGGIDFAILEDRKFKSGPEHKIPKMGPRPDHINNPDYDRKAVDLEGLSLLGERQLDFLTQWGLDWTGAEMKAVLSQTAFCGAVHLHGQPGNRLLADLDCNGWPQTGRNRALTIIRRAWAPHLCGDQHLAVTVKHGIDAFGDGPYAFTSPAIVNTIYGRWWHPLRETAGPNPVEGSPLPWTGDYEDGLGNKISMLAYANPEDRTNELKRADGYGLVRFDKAKRTIQFECWPRFAKVSDGDVAQFSGWPIKVDARSNDGRRPVAWLPELHFKGHNQPVVQVFDESRGEVLYTVRVPGNRFQPFVYASGEYTVLVGRDRPNLKRIGNLSAGPRESVGSWEVTLP